MTKLINDFIKRRNIMKKLLNVLLALTLVISAASSVSAIGETYDAPKGTPIIDGTVDDVWAAAPKAQLTHLKAGDLKAEGELPDTCSAYARVMWDETALYFLFDVYDDDFAFDSSQGDWKNDSIYVYIDELKSGDALFSAGQSQIALIPADGLSLVPRKGSSPIDYETAWSFPEENHCVIEFKYVPDYLEEADLKEGFTFPADFQYNDADEFISRPYCLGWSDEDDSATSNIEVWGTITLTAGAAQVEETEAEPETVEETAVEAVEAETEIETTPAEEEVASETVPSTETAPQTFDIGVISGVSAVISLAALAVSKKRA